MQNREMREYRDAIEIMDAIIAGEITDAEGAEIQTKLNAAKGRVGCWTGHDGLTAPLAKHPDADKAPPDMVDGLGKGVCPRCHTYCAGDCQANA